MSRKDIDPRPAEQFLVQDPHKAFEFLPTLNPLKNKIIFTNLEMHFKRRLKRNLKAATTKLLEGLQGGTQGDLSGISWKSSIRRGTSKESL